MRELLEEELPGVTVTTSSEVLPEIFEHERFSTTVANAVLSPLVGGYVRRLGERLAEGGYAGDLLLLHSGGGVMTPRTASGFALRLAGSGIAAGAIAARHVAATCGFRNAIGLDMGGTSTDISLVYDGELRTTKEWQVEYGYPICFPSIEVLTIGAGGGSLAWIDQAGSLRNGPQSAGADPGPACYGRGGTQPTNTDANVVLGRLGTTLVGSMTLDPKAAAEAIEQNVVGPSGSSHRGRERHHPGREREHGRRRAPDLHPALRPREFALVVFGGAGPLYGAALARELSIPTVLVPPNPGITSALGCLLVDIRHDLAQMFLRRTADVDPAEVEAEFKRLEGEARELLRDEGVPEAQMALQRNIAMRYLGQWRSLSVSVDRPLASMDAAVARFHSEHEREYAYRRDDAPVEVYQLQLTRSASPEARVRAPRDGRRVGAAADRLARCLLRGGGRLRRDSRVRPRRSAGRYEDRGPGRHRPARLDHARSAARDGRGRRVAQHPHGSGGGAMSTAEQRTLDPVTFEVLKNAFINTVDQMAEQILRTCHLRHLRATSPTRSATSAATPSCRGARTSPSMSARSTTRASRSSTRSGTTCTRATSSR